MVEFKYGDLWAAKPRNPGFVTVVTTNGTVKTNGECVMGRGIARQARDEIPGLARYLGDLIQEHGNRPFNLGNGIWSLPVKHNWWETADLKLIKASLEEMDEMVDKFNPNLVRFPKPGCGNGGLSWDRVSKHVLPIMDAMETKVEVWDWKKGLK